MTAEIISLNDIEPRSPDVVMRLERMGSFHQTRLSFMRALLRSLKAENWKFERTQWEINSKGVGHAVYSAIGPRNTYSLVAFAHDLPKEKRSDRVIATAWDATFCMFDGIPSDEDVTRLSLNVPKQEAGRISSTELSLSRANRSVRFWQHMVDRLSTGQQPDMDLVRDVGYLMRTTAVYGSGKFGAADRGRVQDRLLMVNPFHIEMLSVYLTRWFTLDLVEHMAREKGGDAFVPLDHEIKRKIGIGNSTGLGMAPFLINHPMLLNQWMTMRETALARVRNVASASDEAVTQFINVLERARINVSNWYSEHPLQVEKVKELSNDLKLLHGYIGEFDFKTPKPWNSLYHWATNNLTIEGQEQLVALMIEPYGDIVDDLASKMSIDEAKGHCINGAMTIKELKETLNQRYHWALDIDYKLPENSHFYWYVSEAKLEPRLGERYNEDNSSYEQPLCVGREIKRLYDLVSSWKDDSIVADFLLSHPEVRHMVRRVQIAKNHPYSEVRDNLISKDMLAINLLRCKLSFFGATHFDPRSDRWVRICMYQNAPYPTELADCNESDWAYPVLENNNEL